MFLLQHLFRLLLQISDEFETLMQRIIHSSTGFYR
jgi:hypothetical protein